jgi:hypothetical protein
LIARKERWGLTCRAWLLGLALMIAFAVVFAVTIYSFLAPTERIPAHLLVVEGWSPPSTMKLVAEEFHSGQYDQVILVRPLYKAMDDYESGLSYGQWLVQLLITNGIPQAKLAALYPNIADKDRTYHAALAVKEWISIHKLSVDALNLATTGPHARRSRLLYQKAFSPGVKVGVIAMQSLTYNPRRWWRTSQGVREVIDETIAYLYARIFFRASSQAPENPSPKSYSISSRNVAV